MRKFFKENGLSIVLISLFLASLAGAAITGYFNYNRQQMEHAAPAVSFRGFLATGTFTNGVFSNWQAATLQLAIFITFTTFLRQRGASHSRRSDNHRKKSKQRGSWIYRNSLSLAFYGLFALSFLLHLIESDRAYNERQDLDHQPHMGIARFAVSPRFWFENTETWQAEFFAIASFVLLSICLRQENSPESKPSESSNHETGKVDA